MSDVKPRISTTCWGGHHKQCSGRSCACDCHDDQRQAVATALSVPVRTCDDCGETYVDWWADESLWDQVVGCYDGSLCFDCFRSRCAVKGIVTVVVDSAGRFEPGGRETCPKCGGPLDRSGYCFVNHQATAQQN
jgi:hypothetical protein